MTVSKQIIEVLDALCEKFGIAVDWTADNVLPYAKELCGKAVAYELWTSVMYLVFCAVLVIVGCAIAHRVYGELSIKLSEEEITITAFIFSISCFIAIIGIIIMLKQANDIIKCMTFQEKIIYDLVKNTTQAK